MTTAATQQVVNVEEVYRRLANVASQAVREGFDALVVLDPANVYYLSGFRTTLHTRFTAVALRSNEPENAILIAPSVDRRLALDPIWFPSLLTRTEIYYEGTPEDGPLANSPGAVLDRVIQAGDTIGVDLALASYGQVQMVRERYPDANLTDATDILHDVRRVKSAGEIEALRTASQVAISALSKVSDLLRRGMTEIDLATQLDSIARKHGADGFAYPTLIGFGPKSLAPHAPPTSRALERDQIVTIAFGPTVQGYCADIVHTFFFGQPPDLAVESGRNCVEIQAAALNAVKAGARAGDLMQAAHTVIRRLYPDAPAFGRAGHSLGLTIHETPSLTPDNDLPLEVDMVLAIEPGAPPFAMDGIGLYRHCDVVRVTADGYELLTPFDRGLLVVSGKDSA